uniref:Uncharacterized protein n=1 Tax=Amphiprion ocellaris TaxID=80972 RepID=A0AAQ5ZRY0_AMPOC
IQDLEASLAQLCVGALQTGLLALAAQRVLFDELVSRAAVQTQLQPAIVAAHAADDDGGADVPGLYLHLPAHSGAASLSDGQAAALAAAASPILKGQRQILSGGLVHLLICTAVVGLENHCDLKQGEKNKIITLCFTCIDSFFFRVSMFFFY